MYLKSQKYSVASSIVDYESDEGAFNPRLSVAVNMLFIQDDIYVVMTLTVSHENSQLNPLRCRGITFVSTPGVLSRAHQRR